MSSNSRDVISKRVFSDRVHYPYGFSRSGDFSIAESKALSQYGSLISALVDGVISPETEFEGSLLAAALGKQTPTHPAEKAWQKYQARIHRPKMGSIYGGKTAATTDNEGDDNGDDDTVSLDNTDLDISLADE